MKHPPSTIGTTTSWGILAPDPALIGTPVRFFGKIWVIVGINYLHTFDVVRFDAARRVWQSSSIGVNIPVSSPHYWTIPAPEMKGRFALVICNAERLHPRMQRRSKSAKAWRRARAYRNQLKRFFERLQTPRPARYIRPD